MIEAFRVGITIALMNKASGVLGMIARDFDRTEEHAKKLKRTMKEIGVLTIGGGVLAGVGLAGFHAIGKWSDAATEYEQAFARFQALNLGSAVNKDADKFAQATRLMGVSATDLMTTLSDLHVTFGTYDHAKAMAPLAARMVFANKAVFGPDAKFSNAQALRMQQVMEMRGGFKNTASMNAQMDFMQKVISGTSGRVMPSDFYQFIRRAGTAGALQSDKNFYFQMEPIIQEMGGATAGTGLMSAYQNWAQGRTTVRAAREMMRLGFVDPKMAEFNKLGQLNRVKPGGAAGSDLVAGNPREFVRSILLPAFTKHGITSQNAVINEIGALFTNRTASNFYQLIYRQQAKIDKNMAVNARAMGITALGREADNKPEGIRLRAEKSWENLRIQLGLKVLPILLPMIDKLAVGLQYLAGAAQKHPSLTKWLVVSAVGLSALAVAAGGVAAAAGSIMLLAVATGGAVAAGTVLIITGIATGITILGAAVIAWWPQIKGFFSWIAQKAGQAWKWAVTDPASRFHASVGEMEHIGPDGKYKGTMFAAPAKPVPVGIAKRSATTIHNTIVLDGKVISRSVTKHLNAEADRPDTGPSRFDPRESMLRPSHAF